jgi:hypothetical protein
MPQRCNPTAMLPDAYPMGLGDGACLRNQEIIARAERTWSQKNRAREGEPGHDFCLREEISANHAWCVRVRTRAACLSRGPSKS